MKKTKIGDLNEPIVNHIIDLHTNNQSLQLIRSCYIDLGKRTRLGGILDRKPEGDYKLSVSYRSDSRLIVLDSARLFQIKYGEQKAESVEINAKANKIDFQLYLNPNQIVDCNDIETSSNSIYTLEYTLNLSDLSGTILTKEDGIVSISIGNLKNDAPIFEFEHNDIGEKLTYSLSVEKPVMIGFLKIRHSGNFLRSPECNVRFDISAGYNDFAGHHVDVPDLIFMKGDAVQVHPRIFMSGTNIKPENKDASDFLASVNRSYATFRNLCVNKETPLSAENDNVVTIPLFWDMTKAKNPLTDYIDYQLHINAEYSFGRNTTGTGKAYCDLPVRLRRNKVLMDLEVLFSDDSITEIVTNGNPAHQRIPEMISGATTEYRIELKNTAQSSEPGKEDAKIFIRNFNMQMPNNGYLYSELEKGEVNVHTFSPSGAAKIGNEDCLSIGINKSVSFGFEYDHTCIDKIYADDGSEAYKRVIKIPVSFRYCVDKNASYNAANEIPQDKWIDFGTTLQILMQKEPKPDWLCIDYGTSAIVASYGDHMHDEHGNAQNRLIKLKETKKKKINSWYKGNKDMLKDNTEDSRYLITSVAVVNNVKNEIGDKLIEDSIRNIDNYVDSTVWLSPTSGMVDIYSRMLPSLKTLIGNKYFPEQLLPAQVRVDGSISVDKLFELIYKQMFTHFLPEDVKDTNKLVLTVPNTYAPCHIEILKRQAFMSLKKLRPDYLRFISESDAVAFYYLSKRHDYIRNTDIVLDDDFDKNVLVYDMGAGTLDLTYFIQKAKGGKTQIDIKGKMGVARAGNYLDYLLAEIIVNTLKTEIQKQQLWKDMEKLLSLKAEPNRDGVAAGILKQYVRDQVKPLLNQKEDLHLPALKLFNNYIPTDALTIGDIVNHHDFRQYLDEVSKNVLAHFKQLFSDEEHDVKPTLVIFSGRTTCIRLLRSAVKDALANLDMVQDGHCIYLDLSNGRFSRDVEANGSEVGSLKTAVVNGAMAFCADFAAGKGDYVLNSKNVFAQYGVVFKVASGWIWENLIDTHTEPINKDEAQDAPDGFTVYEYDSSEHNASDALSVGSFRKQRCKRDFTGISAAYVIQSYSSDTEMDWINENRDMISVIGYADLCNVTGEKEYKLTIDSSNRLHFCVGAAQMPLLAHDEYAIPSFQKSMWPIVR